VPTVLTALRAPLRAPSRPTEVVRATQKLRPAGRRVRVAGRGRSGRVYDDKSAAGDRAGSAVGAGPVPT